MTFPLRPWTVTVDGVTLAQFQYLPTAREWCDRKGYLVLNTDTNTLTISTVRPIQQSPIYAELERRYQR